MEEIKIMDG